MLESYYSYQREDGWFIVELYQFNSDQGMVDLEIQFQQLDSNYLLIEGIEFRPLEEQVVEHVSSSPSEEDDSEDESFWERKLPIDYQHLIKLSRDTTIMRFKTYKELYSILCKGFLVKGGLEWVSVDKNGNICVMQAPEAVFANDRRFKKWHHLPESRFGKMLEVFDTRLKFEGKIISRVLSLQTTYACYLVYKIVSGLTFYRFPLKVSDATDLASGDWKVPDIRYIFLYVPQTPVIVGGKADRDIYKPLNKTNLKGIPILRSDGLMEVQLFEYQAASGKKIPTHLAWYNEHNVKLEGLIIEGIEFRPI
ncbi:F-box protein VBF-like [Rutidosis leptorrhynchoides]|uniref:F-box protein VBF-like n=1 Tax=Rutidosis leptorrhynchoides TaxID=125765 RepID=UPI003A99C119